MIFYQFYFASYRGETPALYQVLPEKKVDKVSGMMGSTHIYDVPAAPPGGPIGTKRPEGPGSVEIALDPSELDLVDTEAMSARYEQQLKESQLAKEDLSDVVAEHISRQKVNFHRYSSFNYSNIFSCSHFRCRPKERNHQRRRTSQRRNIKNSNFKIYFIFV